MHQPLIIKRKEVTRNDQIHEDAENDPNELVEYVQAGLNYVQVKRG